MAAVGACFEDDRVMHGAVRRALSRDPGGPAIAPEWLADSDESGAPLTPGADELEPVGHFGGAFASIGKIIEDQLGGIVTKDVHSG